MCLFDERGICSKVHRIFWVKSHRLFYCRMSYTVLWHIRSVVSELWTFVIDFHGWRVSYDTMCALTMSYLFWTTPSFLYYTGGCVASPVLMVWRLAILVFYLCRCTCTFSKTDNGFTQTFFYKGPSWPWSYGSWIYSYLCNLCLSPLKLWAWISHMAVYTRYNSMW